MLASNSTMSKIILWIITFSYIYQAIGLMSRVFANRPRDWASIPGRIIAKNKKIVPDADLFSTQHYTVWIKGK